MYGYKTWLLTTEEERKAANKNKLLRKYYDLSPKNKGRIEQIIRKCVMCAVCLGLLML
jgi:hypothetical protein